jgi:GMP synthase (glutamine-hydrolysing)
MQLIAHTFGGTVVRMCDRERGTVQVTELVNDPGVTEIIRPRWMNHRDLVTSLPDQFQITAVTSNNHIAAFTDHRKWWAIQYHPESHDHVDLTIFQRFLGLPGLPQSTG